MRKIAAILFFGVLLLTFALHSSVVSAKREPQRKGGILFAAPGGTSTACSSWADACELQTALGLAAAGDEIWVQAGIYKATTGTDSTISFVLKNGVAIYGGFLGSETAREQRDWESNPTILSGEIGNPEVHTDNTYHVVRADGVDASAVLDGFIIEHGNTYWSDPDVRGGGIYCLNNASPVFRDIILRHNYSERDGAGMYNNSSAPSLYNVTFENNTAEALGGGMSNRLSNPIIVGATFSGNHAGYGGGMYNDGSNPSIQAAVFEDNTASLNGGGLSNWFTSSPYLKGVDFVNNSSGTYGGAIMNYNSSPIMEEVLISDNTSAEGGGMYSWGVSGGMSDPKMKNVTFEFNTATAGDGGALYNKFSNPTLKFVTIHANQSVTRYGGGIYNVSSSPKLEDVTISNNTSLKAGGGMYNTGTYTDRSTPSLLRVVFFGNVASSVSYGDGGGMFNYDWCSPTMTDVVFQENSAGHDGGGMYNNQATFALLRRVLFTGNFSDNHGGGLFNTAAYPDLENVTFYGNTANENGGGMCSWAVIDPLSMVNVTFVNNTTVYGDGGGIFNSTTNGYSLRNAIVWGNSPTQIVGGGTVTYSAIQGGFGGEGNTSVDPLLEALADNGGFSKTVGLQTNSPAVDAGNPELCPDVDQRGFMRPFDGDGSDGARCDMGAYEYGSYPEAKIYLPMLLK